MIDDISEEAKQLFDVVIRKDATAELYKVLKRIMNNSRNHIDWGAVYYDIVTQYPEYDRGRTTSIESVDQSLEQFCGISGFYDDLEEAGYDVVSPYSFNELWDLLWEYDERNQLHLSNENIAYIIRRAFNGE